MPGRPWLTVLLIGLSLAGLGAAIALWSPWLAVLATVLWLVGVCWWLGGGPLLRACLPALALILTIIPPPFGLDTDLTTGLRSLAVGSSARLLDLAGVVQTTSGNIIELPTQKLLVEEACSGINSVLFMLATCLFYTLWLRRSSLRIVISLALTLSFVLLGNIFRIAFGAWLLYRHQVNLLEGWPHEVLGLVLVAGYLALILSLDQALTFLASPIYEAELAEDDSEVPVPARQLLAISPRWGHAAAAAFLLLGFTGAAVGWRHHVQAKQQFIMAANTALPQGATFSLPEQLQEWRRLDAGAPTARKIETLGIYSHVWQYQRGALVATVALDYPFRGFHDVSICYQNAGWTIAEERQRGAPGTGQPPLVELVMTREGLERGWLLYGTVNEQGAWQPLPQRGVQSRLSSANANEAPTYRVQVLLTGYAPMTPAARQQAWQLFETARSQLWEQLASQFKTGVPAADPPKPPKSPK
jgi:exosortase